MMNYTVSSLTKYLKSVVEGNSLLKSLAVEGEISNYNHNKSGHRYFNLKEGGTVLKCVLFAGDSEKLKFNLADGQKVVAKGRISVYPEGGIYQLIVSTVELQGQGELYKKFLELKEALANKGLFDEIYKVPIPKYIKTLGVVTSPTGAAIQDITNVTKRRNPYIQIVLSPARVQGEGAEIEIARAIERLDDYGVDVMIVGRGGGSAEDLWCFNEEVVAEAIFACNTPVISAVGHEIDFSISDFVADLRAPTPSAAAELAVYEYSNLMDSLERYSSSLAYEMQDSILANRHDIKEKENRLGEAIRYRLDYARERVISYESQLSTLHPGKVIAQKKERLSQIRQSLNSKIQHSLELTKIELAQNQNGVNSYMFHSLELAKKKLSYYAGGLEGYSPLKRLAQGYSYLTDTAGRNLNKIKDISIGQRVRLQVSDGAFEAEVKDIKE